MKNDSDPTKDAPAPIGARQENSSLFSLEALKKQEALALEAEPKRTEDSGIIDLKALAIMQKAEKTEGSRSFDVARVQAPDIFQIGMVSQLAAPQPIALAAPPEADAPKPRSKVMPIAGGVAAIAVIAGVAFFLGRGAGNQPTAGVTPATSTTVAAPPPATPTATATATATQDEVAAITPGEHPSVPTATAVATASAKAPPVVPGRLAGPMPKPKPAPEAPAAPAPPVNTCDLACQMKRAVEGKH
jgi:hypothetical protein